MSRQTETSRSDDEDEEGDEWESEGVEDMIGDRNIHIYSR